MPTTRHLRLAATLTVGALACPGLARAEASATGTALAQVVVPITVSREADLDFGTVAVSATGAGTVRVDPLSAAASYTGGVGSVCGSACAGPHPARFAVQGEPGRAYQVTLPGQLAIPGPAGTAAVLVNSLVAAAASSPQAGRGILSGSGKDLFEVGGTLHVPASAPPTRYTTQVPVIVDYL